MAGRVKEYKVFYAYETCFDGGGSGYAHHDWGWQESSFSITAETDKAAWEEINKRVKNGQGCSSWGCGNNGRQYVKSVVRRLHYAENGELVTRSKQIYPKIKGKIHPTVRRKGL